MSDIRNWCHYSAAILTVGSVTLLGNLVFLGLGDGRAAAQGRPDTRAMSCAHAQALVKQRGSVVMSTGQHTFEQFVYDAGFCVNHNPITRPLYAPTRDNPECPVGKRCVDRTPRDR